MNSLLRNGATLRLARGKRGGDDTEELVIASFR